MDDEDGEDDGSGSGSGDYGKKIPWSVFKPLCFLELVNHDQSILFILHFL